MRALILSVLMLSCGGRLEQPAPQCEGEWIATDQNPDGRACLLNVSIRVDRDETVPNYRSLQCYAWEGDEHCLQDEIVVHCPIGDMWSNGENFHCTPVEHQDHGTVGCCYK